MPKTIDNDVSGTITTFGFDTAVNTALEAIEPGTTAESHDRVIVLEVMGATRASSPPLGTRRNGRCHPHSGIPYDIERVCDKIMSATAPAGISPSSLSPRAHFRRAGGSR